MRQRAGRVAGRQDLVDVVEQPGGLDGGAVDRDAWPSIRAARKPATSPTARECAGTTAGDRGTSRRAAASTRPGTVIGSMVPDCRPPDRAPPGTTGRIGGGGVGTAADVDRDARTGSPPPASRADRTDGPWVAIVRPWRLGPDGQPAVRRTPPSPTRRGRSAGRALPPPAAARASRVPDGRTGCPARPTRPRPPAATASMNASRRGRPAAMVGDLEQVDPRQAAAERARGSMSSSTSPARRNRREPTVPSSTTDTLLIPVPLSGGSAGTCPRIGHRTRRSTSSTASRSPAADRPARGAPAGRSASIHAA